MPLSPVEVAGLTGTVMASVEPNDVDDATCWPVSIGRSIVIGG